MVGPGRPPKKGAPKSKSLTLRLTPGDYWKLKYYAEKIDGTITAWLERKVAEAAKELPDGHLGKSYD